MTLSDDIASALEADTGSGGVATLLTGGVYTWEETGRLGVNRDKMPTAFNSTTGLLKPCCIVKVRSETPDNGIQDDATQDISYRAVVELWFYNDGDATLTTLTSARDRALVVLHGKMIGSTKYIPRWIGNPVRDARDAELDYAVVMRADYDVRALA